MLPNYDNKIGKLQEVISLVVAAVSKSRNCKATSDNEFKGKGSSDILYLCLEILSAISYFNVEKTFSTLIKFYSESESENEKRRIEEAIKSLAEYKLDILKIHGAYVQYFLIGAMASWDIETIYSLKEIVLIVCAAVLKSEASGASWKYDDGLVGTISRANIRGTPEITMIRTSAIEILKKLYDKSVSDEGKIDVLAILRSCTYPPVRGVGENSLLIAILQNSKQIVDFYIEKIPTVNYQILQNFELHVRHLYKFTEGITENLGMEVNTKSKPLKESISRFRKAVDIMEYYTVYKTLIGHEDLSPESWDDNYYDRVIDANKNREEKISRLACAVNESNSDEWVKCILSCAATNSRDTGIFYGADLRGFCIFLDKLAQENPNFVLQLVSQHEAQIEKLLVSILNGLLSGQGREPALALIKSWARQGKNLCYSAKLFEIRHDLDISLLREIYQKAKEYSDLMALSQVLLAAITLYTVTKERALLDELIIPIFKEFDRLEYSDWMYGLRNSRVWPNFIKSIDESYIGILLESFIYVKDIRRCVDELLTPIAERVPDKVLKLFIKRLSRQKIGHYDAIPYDLGQLREPLATIPEQAIDIVSQDYIHYYDFRYGGARLLSIVFEQPSGAFKKKLLKLVSSGESRNLEIAIAILRNYSREKYELRIMPSVPAATNFLKGDMTYVLFQKTPESVPEALYFVDTSASTPSVTQLSLVNSQTIGGLIEALYPSVKVSAIKELSTIQLTAITSFTGHTPGNLSVYDLCKKIVTLLPEESELLEEVAIIMQATGIVEGFGFADIYENKKLAISAWLADENIKTKRFATKLIAELNNMISTDRRRVALDMEYRKHQFKE